MTFSLKDRIRWQRWDKCILYKLMWTGFRNLINTMLILMFKFEVKFNYMYKRCYEWF